MTLAILIPAAGFGRRMNGVDKLLEPVDGTPLLRVLAMRALQASPLVAVAVPTRDHPRTAALHGLDVQIVPVPDNAQGMSASLRTAVPALPDTASGLMILPGDMPDLETADFICLINRFNHESGRKLIQATSEDGRPGHPVVFPVDCFSKFATLTGDAGARTILKANKARLVHVPLSGDRALTDLDTPEAWACWRARKQAD